MRSREDHIEVVHVLGRSPLTFPQRRSLSKCRRLPLRLPPGPGTVAPGRSTEPPRDPRLRTLAQTVPVQHDPEKGKAPPVGGLLSRNPSPHLRGVSTLQQRAAADSFYFIQTFSHDDTARTFIVLAFRVTSQVKSQVSRTSTRLHLFASTIQHSFLTKPYNTHKEFHADHPRT